VQFSQIALMAVAAAEEEGGGHGQSLASEVVLRIGPLEISNHILSAWFVMLVLVLVAFLATRSMKLVPTGLQNFAEVIVEGLMGLIEQVAGSKGRAFAPVVMTAFLFILSANWLGTLPIFGNIHVVDEAHHTGAALLKSPNSSLNVTASMAIIVFLLSQVFAIRTNGVLGYLKEFVVPNPLHILTELSRPLSLSLRLFGNIFAGGVLVHTMLGMPSIVPIVTFIFLGLELFVGVVQALIFTMLTLVFLTIAVTPHHGDHAAHEGAHAEAHH
jgi:F-type H+-transporting ATPase subunit a